MNSGGDESNNQNSKSNNQAEREIEKGKNNVKEVEKEDGTVNADSTLCSCKDRNGKNISTENPINE